MAAIDMGLIDALVVLGLGIFILYKPGIVSERPNWQLYIKIGGVAILLFGIIHLVSYFNHIS